MLKRIVFISLLVFAVAIGAFAAGQTSGPSGKKSADSKASGSPTTLIHFITVKWKDDATAEQKQAALDGAKKMVGVVPGLHRVWTKKIKLQTTTEGGKNFDAIIAMEFTDQAALDAYATHPAHDEWYKVYTPIREESRTHDVSN